MDNYQILLEKLANAKETFLSRQTHAKEKISILEQNYVNTQNKIFKLNKKIEEDEELLNILKHYKERLKLKKRENFYTALGFYLLLNVVTILLPIMLLQFLHIKPMIWNLNTYMPFIVSSIIYAVGSIIFTIIINAKTTKQFKDIIKNNNADSLSKRITRNKSEVRKLTKVNKKTSEKIEQLKKQAETYDATISNCNEIIALLNMAYNEAIMAVTYSQNYEQLINKEFELDKELKDIIVKVRKKENLGGK